MSLPFNQIRTAPGLKDLLDQLKRDIFLTFNCCHVATVQSFDTENGTLNARVNYSKTVSDSQGNQTSVNYPNLIDLPVFALAGGNCALTMPIAPGDQVMVLFNDRDLDNWFQGARSGQLNSPRLHSFSDGIALVGLNDISGWDAVRALLSNGIVKLGINPTSNKVLVSNQSSGTLGSILSELITGILGMTAGGSPMVDVTGKIASAATALGGLLE